MSDLVIPPGYGRVVGRVLRAVTVETGPAPLVGARVTVRPSVARVTRDGDPTPLIVGDAIECTLDDNGFLLGPDGERGVLLVATDADTRPAGWHWLVRVSAPSVASYQWQVLVPEGVTTDMVSAMSDPAVSGLPLLEWRGILTEVWDAHADVMSAAGAVDHDRQLAVAARAGAEQAAGRAETASSQAVTAQGAAEAAADTAETYASQAASSAQDAASLEASALAHKGAAASSAQAAEGGAQDAEAAAAAAANSAGSAFDDAAIAQGARLGAEAARDAAAGSATAAQTAAAALQDTGWRDVSAALHEDCTGTLLVRRIGARVTARFNITSQVTTNYMRIWQMPDGWRPVVNWEPIGMVPYGITGTALTVGPLGWAWLLDARHYAPLETDTAMSGELSWLTNNAFPSPAAYPGTPA